ncbi:hypothetical protein J2X72_003901 [Phyllobacterium sp. 1468]|uniref:hypothetical protein n=1 Tax=Phyllobacterium sp. 1468 TaxID=2817759 RepID=UPI00285680EC|nr:hypothetical protein [Phyllobacterium sp. 1468]MDR6635089.1 hypothetical protein [Phyllobacterium sp. 1468]
MFGRKNMHDEYAKIVREIDEGERREPQHNRPTETKSKWGSVDPIDQYVFDEFSWLGATIDRWTDDSWSLEETNDTNRRASYLDSPEYGRRWIIYYNKLGLGWLEVSATPEHILGTLDEFKVKPSARIDMSLDFMRFIPSEDAFGMLYNPAFLMQSTEAGYDAARERAKLIAESTMTHYMWDVMRAGEGYVPDLEFSVSGPWSVFSETVSHWKKSGFDPRTEMSE